MSKIKPSEVALNSVSTKRVIETADNIRSDEEREDTVAAVYDFIAEPISTGIIEINKLADLEHFFIVTYIQQKYSKVNVELNEASVKESIKNGIHFFLRKLSKIKSLESIKESSHDLGHHKRHNAEKKKEYKTFSEKKMDRIDEEIRKQIEEAVVREKGRMRLDLFKSDSSDSFVKKRVAIQSKIKEVREIDPEFLIHMKKSPDNSKCIKQDIQGLLNHGRSTSSLNYSPTDSRVTPYNSQYYYRSGWYDNMKKKYHDSTKGIRMLSEDFTSVSEVAKDFVTKGEKMQKSLRSAFRTKVSLDPSILFNKRFKKFTY